MKKSFLKVLIPILFLLTTSCFVLSCKRINDDPDNPNNPNNPDNPDDPDNPDTPDNPDNPGASDSVKVTFINADETEITSVVIEKNEDGKFIVSYDTTKFTPATGYKYQKCTDKDGNDIVFGETEITADCNLTVLFEPISYTIVFSKAMTETLATSITGNLPASIQCKYDQEITLPANTLKKSAGTNPAGWYLSGNAETKFTDGQKVKNLTAKDGDEVKLTAYFTDKDYTITFKDCNYTKFYYLNDGETIETIPECAEKRYYTCSGYYDETDTTKTIVDFTSYEYTKDVTFVALYVPIKYKVTFVNDKGTAPAIKEITVDDDAFVFSSNGGLYEPTVTGYRFDGWYNGTESYSYITVENIGAKDITLTAKWTPASCAVHLYEKPTSWEYDDFFIATFGETVKLPKWAGKRNGYKFLGWALSTDKTTKVYDDEADFTWNDYSLKSGSSIDLYALWQPSSITVTFAEPNTEDDIQLICDDENECFKAVLDGVTEFKWFVKGIEKTAYTTDTFEFANFDRSAGESTLMVTAVKNGLTYSKTIYIDIKN